LPPLLRPEAPCQAMSSGEGVLHLFDVGKKAHAALYASDGGATFVSTHNDRPGGDSLDVLSRPFRHTLPHILRGLNQDEAGYPPQAGELN